ncbi:MAG: TIGR02300 family protein [Alphaproteobacteria bacterium]|nr:TIGR02300 family protein [Alphaproteobacteria bacterium]OJV47816.1 MAG: TIGR02300 family protein [Alphaproteobacteria bacterium 43-37]
MASSALGMKRHCLSCGARFYDLKKSPIVCPKCSATFDPDAVFKAKKSRSAAAIEAANAIGNRNSIDPESLLETELDVDLGSDAEDDALIEDTDDLGEDDSMAEVIEHIESDEDR